MAKKAKEENVVAFEPVTDQKILDELKKIKYPTWTIVKTKIMKSYGLNDDILLSILTEDSYTIADARKAVISFLNKEA